MCRYNLNCVMMGIPFLQPGSVVNSALRGNRFAWGWLHDGIVFLLCILCRLPGFFLLPGFLFELFLPGSKCFHLLPCLLQLLPRFVICFLALPQMEWVDYRNPL